MGCLFHLSSPPFHLVPLARPQIITQKGSKPWSLGWLLFTLSITSVSCGTMGSSGRQDQGLFLEHSLPHMAGP